jgi:tRNA threonylcarbamoyladenosine biosynthesis protein TsaB
MMRVLALDTTTRAGSIALVEDDRVVAERRGDASRSHGERLPSELLALLGECELPVSSIDVFAVAAGPGSFTGLRIGIATIQGLAFVEHRRVVAVSALEATAHAVSGSLPAGVLVGAWIDALRHDVFSALYRTTAAQPFTPDRLVELESAAVGAPAATLARWLQSVGRPAVLAGTGATTYAALLSREVPTVEPPSLAGAIGRLAAIRAQRGEGTDPAGVQPLYVRRPDAEIARERQ